MNCADYLNRIIYNKKTSIPDILCDEIINKFNNNTNRHREGNTLGGIQKAIKDTKDMLIPKKDKEWEEIERFLYTELHRNLKIYLDSLTFEGGMYLDKNNDNVCFVTDNFMIQKYEQNVGKYVYHNDGYIDYANERDRVITFLWYLNDIEEGGETEFFGNFKIKPEKGKLILFPAAWAFPHCGLMPKSSNKYILTGWIYRIDK
jgi:hypothetical protein